MKARIFLVSVSLLILLTVLMLGLKSNWAQEPNPPQNVVEVQAVISQDNALQDIADKLDKVLANQDKIQAKLDEMQQDLIHKIKIFGTP